MAAADGFLSIDGCRLEYAWHGPAAADAPTLVFLHEGLGCTALWRDVPEVLAARTGCGALVYSRAGYGRSDACALPRPIGYMHDEALTVLPRVLAATGIRDAVLVGHSDGASIALIYAGAHTATCVRGIVLEAPHIFIEEESRQAIAAAKVAFEGGDLRARLARHHGDNVDVAFRGWSECWLEGDFAAWNLEDYAAALRLPALVIQGDADPYGTMAHARGIERLSQAAVEVLALPGCGHAPHRERREDVLDAIALFVARSFQANQGFASPG